MSSEPLTIQQIEIYQNPIPLKEQFITSLGLHDCAENVIVVIRTANGLTGYGECSPYAPINGENMDTTFTVARLLAKVLIGKDALNIEAAHALMDKVIYTNNSIKSAFDIALYDIAAQQAGVPLYKLLGGNNNKKLVTDYTVSIGEPGKMAADAIKIKNNGYTIIKVKLGETKDKDVERIRAIREAIGNKIALRIDANQGWSVDTAIETLQALALYGIQYCEEPIARWNYMQLPQVRKQSPIPIMGDECCCDHHDAHRLINIGACDMFNIKLGKSAGIFKARKIVELAEEAKMKLQVGGFLESRLGFTASAHLALSSNNILHCDFDTPLMFISDPVTGGITYSKGGFITVPETPGLGASVDASYLNNLVKQVIN